MFGRLYVPTGSVTPLTVPRDAVRKIGQLDLVWVLSEDNQRTKRYVRTGKVFEDRVEILSGLDEGERVIITEE